MSDTKPKKTTGPKAGAKGLVYALPSSTLTMKDGRVYVLGTSCDDMTEADQKKHAHRLKPAGDAK